MDGGELIILQDQTTANGAVQALTTTFILLGLVQLPVGLILRYRPNTLYGHSFWRGAFWAMTLSMGVVAVQHIFLLGVTLLR